MAQAQRVEKIEKVKKVTSYVILAKREADNTYIEIGAAAGGTPKAATEAVVGTEVAGTWLAVPTSSFHEVVIEIEQPPPKRTVKVVKRGASATSPETDGAASTNAVADAVGRMREELETNDTEPDQL